MPTPPLKLKITTLWDENHFQPNANQKKAILHLEGPLYLPAGPGSGKTRVLLWRTINLIVFHGIQPEEILLATFTEKAALQLREGLRAYLGQVTVHTEKPYDLAKIYVGTMHSLCHRMINDRRFQVNGLRITNPTLMDELEQYLYVYREQWKEITEVLGENTGANKAINRVFGQDSVSRHSAVTNCISVFNRLSEECLTAKDVRKRTKDPELLMFAELYEAYCDSLQKNNRVPRTDFALLQQKALEILENKPDSERIFKHIIVDEYQDTNTIQERLYFKLAAGYQNLCVVGDDDQALYRFRGATVENFVDFPQRCLQNYGVEPTKITLSTNYRSPEKIVHFFTDFISHPTCDWRRSSRSNEYYRVTDKGIHAQDQNPRTAVIASTPNSPEKVCEEIADLVEKIIRNGKVQDPNQVAFLYPSLKSVQVGRMMKALEARGLKPYAPRAGRFLEVEEATSMLGLFLEILGQPERGDYGGHDYGGFHDWMDSASGRAKELIKANQQLKLFVKDRQAEIEKVIHDYQILVNVAQANHWELDTVYDQGRMQAKLLAATGLSAKARGSITSKAIIRAIGARKAAKQAPYKLNYLLSRVTSLDWNVLDLFYRLCGFEHFKSMMDLAECGKDEGPICNLGLISQYLSRFIDSYNISILTGRLLAEGRFSQQFFSSFLYALYRRGESEYEDAEDPFPRGRIPFLTIHQAKGLEFPVVVLGNPSKTIRHPQRVEELVQPLLKRKGEPLDRMTLFDMMRMFYVALSRPQNLMVIAHYKGSGQSVNEPFRSLLNESIPRIPGFDISTLPDARIKTDELPKNYSYAGDYILYQRCPRQYMVFRKYGFVPSRSQTMFFGSLVHQTLDDLHQFLISRRKQA